MPKLTLPGGIVVDGVRGRYLAALAVMFMLGVGIRWWYEEVYRPEQVARDLQRQVTEYGKHFGETPDGQAVLVDDARGRLVVSHYADDCLVQTGTTARGHTHAKLTFGVMGGDTPAAVSLPPMPWWEAVLAATASPCDSYRHGRVVDQREVGRDGAWIYVQRVFEDRCAHVQAVRYDGLMDAPKWTVCRH